MKTKNLLLLAPALCSLLGGTISAFAQGTAFTYQGRLTDNAGPANGVVELQGTLWNALSGGAQVAAATPATTIISVTNGLFTVPLDFGTTAFDGSDRYLQLEMRTTIGPFTRLTPRQKITATPYALLAGKLSGTVGNSGLGGTYGNAVTFSNAANVFNGAFTGNGGELTNLNAASLGGLSPSDFWKVGGNAGTTAGANFIGTADNQPLELKASAQRALRLEPATVTNALAPDYSVIWSNAPNVIGGARVNGVGGGVVGASIGGGGLTGGYVDSGAGYVFAGSVSNHIASIFGTVGGGYGNIIKTNASLATIGGGGVNTIESNALYATIGGGQNNTVQGDSSTIGGGARNTIQSASGQSTIGGGGGNTISNAFDAAIAGGSGNKILNRTPGAFIGGGGANIIRGPAPGGDNSHSVICGGFLNVIGGSASRAFIGGGDQNTNYAQYGMIGGGSLNAIGSNAFAATIAGGFNNIVWGSGSFAAGRNCDVRHNGTFMWSDGTLELISGRDNAFYTLATGGHYFYSGWGVGVQLAPGGNSWSAISDRNMKENFEPVDCRNILEKVVSMPVTTWSLKTQPDDIRHIGVMAQDFKAAFAVGEDERHISTSDADGVAIAAIQGLHQIVQEKDAMISDLEKRLRYLEKKDRQREARLVRLEERLRGHDSGLQQAELTTKKTP